MFFAFFILPLTYALSYVCNYANFDLSSTHYLYKEEDLPIVKWLPKNTYCKDKGDVTVYTDAGQPKCEYSRGICEWQSGNCVETLRPNDDLQTCLDLLEQNTLSTELDSDRLSPPTPSPPTVWFISSSEKSRFCFKILVILLLLQ